MIMVTTAPALPISPSAAAGSTRPAVQHQLAGELCMRADHCCVLLAVCCMVCDCLSALWTSKSLMAGCTSAVHAEKYSVAYMPLQMSLTQGLTFARLLDRHWQVKRQGSKAGCRGQAHGHDEPEHACGSARRETIRQALVSSQQVEVKVSAGCMRTSKLQHSKIVRPWHDTAAERSRASSARWQRTR